MAVMIILIDGPYFFSALVILLVLTQNQHLSRNNIVYEAEHTYTHIRSSVRLCAPAHST